MSYQIRVNCTCGKILKIPEKYAGKRGRCPNCGKKIAIPSMNEIKNKIETQQEPVKQEKSCPVCGAFMAPDANICVSCRSNLKTGEWDAAGQDLKQASSRNLHFIGILVILGIVVLVTGIILVHRFSQKKVASNGSQTAHANAGGLSAIQIAAEMKKISEMPEKTSEELQAKIEAIQYFFEKRLANSTMIKTYNNLLQKKRETMARVAHQNLPANNVVSRWLALDKMIARFQETDYAKSKLQEEYRNAEKEVVLLARTQVSNAQETFDNNKHDQLLRESVAWFATMIKRTCPIGEFKKEVEALAKICDKALSGKLAKVENPVIPKKPEPKEEEVVTLDEFKKQLNAALPVYYDFTSQWRYRKALAKIQPLAKMAEELQKKHEGDPDITKVVRLHTEIKQLNRLWDYVIEGAESLKGKTTIIFPKKGDPYNGVVIKYEDGNLYIKKVSREGVIEKGMSKVLLNQLSPTAMIHKLARSGNNKTNPDTYVTLSCFYYMNKEEGYCIDAANDAAKLGASPSQVENYQKWAKGVIDEKKQSDLTKQAEHDKLGEKITKIKEENRMERLRRTAWRIVNNILIEYKRKNDLGVLNLLGDLKRQIGDRYPDGRDELIKISKTLERDQGHSLIKIAETAFNYCNYCQEGKLTCPKCKGVGEIGGEERWIGPGSVVKNPVRVCPLCHGAKVIFCPYCIKKRDDRTYIMIKDYYCNF